ncbi:MAG: hypothetical protein ABIK09_03385 [Pseudomonadota bacterium]
MRGTFILATFLGLILVFGGAAAAPSLPPGLRVDRSLLPLDGAAEENIRLLEATLASSASPRFEALLGIQHLGLQDSETAARICRRAMESAVTMEPPYCLALVAYHDSDFDAVAPYLAQARARDPEHPATYLLEAYVAAAQGDAAAMVGALEAGQRATPDEQTALWEWELMRLLDRVGDRAGALQAAGKLIQLTPDDAQVYHAAALILEKEERLREAIQMELVCLSKAPWHMDAARRLLEFLERDGQVGEAWEWSKRLLESPHLMPDHEELERRRQRLAGRLAEIRFKELEGRYRLPISEDTIRDADPGIAARLLHGAGRVHLELDTSSDGALNLLRWAERLAPLDSEILVSLGEALVRARRFDDAEEVLSQAAIHGSTPPLHRLLGEIAQAQGDVERCLAEVDAGLMLEPQDVSLQRLSAICNFSAHNNEEALRALRAVLQVAPRDRDAQRLQVDWYRRKDTGVALGLLHEMHAQNPWDFRNAAKAAEVARSRRDRDAEVRWLGELARTLPPHKAADRVAALGRLRELLLADRRLRQKRMGTIEELCAAGVSGSCALAEELREKPLGEVRSVVRVVSTTPEPTADRLVGELERLGDDGADFLVIGLEADGFAVLPTRQKILLYYLARAAIAGDELLYLQNHRKAIFIKQLLERLLSGRDVLPRRTHAAVHDYLKYVWINHGNHDHRSGVKFTPRFLTPKMLRAAMERLARSGETFDFLPGADIAARFAGIRDAIFDRLDEPNLTVTEAGKDVVAESAVNLYDPGVTQAMIDALPETWRNRLNVRFELDPVKGAAVPRVLDVAWTHGARLERIVHFLRKAVPFADDGPQRKSLEHLVEFYITGEEELFRLHSLEWLRTVAATDYLNGFIEQLKDPRGVIGQFEGMAGFLSDSEMVGRLAQNAAYFEERMPWPEEYKRVDVETPISNIIDIVMGTGDMGPVPWAGYNLPNDADIRETHGAKNVIFRNIMAAGSERDRDALIDTFYLAEYREPVRAWGRLARDWLVYMHEVIGHGSGRPSGDLTDDPRNLMGRVFSPLEEMRADLVALYFMADPKLVEIEALPAQHHQEILTTAYVSYFQSFLASYRRFHGDQIKEAHWKGRQAIFMWLVKGGEDGKGDYGLRVVDEGGSVYVKVDDVWKLRKGLEILLEKVQVLKSTANVKDAEALIDGFGTSYEHGWKEDVERRASRIGLATQTAFVFPHLVPVTDAAGAVVDIELRYDEDLTAQQLRFTRLQRGLELD